MEILYGLKDGAVLQREEDGFCKCYFKADCSGKLFSTIGDIYSIGEGNYILSGIPVGGPYEFLLQDDKDVICFHEIYVGDVWILAGQSNMEGAGKMRQKQIEEEKAPISSVRAYYMRECWAPAGPQLHQLWESVDSCIREPFREDYRNTPWKTEYPKVQFDGVGPGFYFALEMQKRTGVPQGVIPCGIGGSDLSKWQPDIPGNLYAAMKRRFQECGANVKGVFWYQGEAQASKSGCASFISDMERLVNGMRRDFKKADLPFVQVQINKYHMASKESNIWWIKIRELQRTLDQRIENLATVYSVDCSLDDLIHLDSRSQEIIGKRGAQAMDALLTKQSIFSPQISEIQIVEDDFIPFLVNIKVLYKNVVGGLCAQGIPSGFFLLKEEDGDPTGEIARLDLEGDAVRIKVELSAEKIRDYYIGYGYGNQYYCNITDGMGRSIPAMGPFKIKDFMAAEET